MSLIGNLGPEMTNSAARKQERTPDADVQAQEQHQLLKNNIFTLLN